MLNNTQSNTRNAYEAAGAAAHHFQEGAAALGRSKDELMQEFRNLISEGESLLKSTTNLSGEALMQARDQFKVKLSDAKKRIDEMSTVAQQNGKRAIAATEGYVRENPWPAVGVAAGVGFVVAMLTMRR